MVEYHTCEIAAPDGIGSVVDILLFTTTNTDETHNNVVAIWTNRIIPQRDSWIWSCLTEDGGVCSDSHVAS